MSEFDNIVNLTAEAAEMRGHAKGHAKEMLADGMPMDKICNYQ